MRLSLALLVASFVLVSCHDSSGSSTSLALGVNDLGAVERVLAFEDGLLVAAVSEPNADRNGGGLESFLGVFDLRSGNRVFLPNVATGYGAKTGAGFVTFLVDEASAGRDLDGDGDRIDLVVHVYDARRGPIRNLGLASYSLPVQRGALIACAPHEQPGLDLNGDGDFDDFVAHVYEADRGRLTPLTTAANGDALWIRGRRVLYLDDPKPTVQVYDADTGQVRSIPHNTDAVWIEGSLLATQIPEWENGNQDLNGNGRTDDGFLELHDLDTGNMHVTDRNDCWILDIGADLAVVALEEDDAHEVRVYDRLTDTLSAPLGAGLRSGSSVSERLFAYVVNEYEAGADLDGDGKLWDDVLHVFDARTGTARNIARAAFSGPQIDGSRVAFLGLGEPSLARPPIRTTVHVLDERSGVVTDTGVMASEFRFVNGIVVALTPEAWLEEDLDGDGELTHTILQVHDLASGETRSTGLTVWYFEDDDDDAPAMIDGDVAALVVDGRLKAIRLR